MRQDVAFQHPVTGEFLRAQMACQVFLLGEVSLEQMSSKSLGMFVSLSAELTLVLEEKVGRVVNSLYVSLEVSFVERLSANVADRFRFFLLAFRPRDGRGAKYSVLTY